jgi:catechol 2,3-dioxygenase-like lactoylglutathione lyase family enzyme
MATDASGTQGAQPAQPAGEPRRLRITGLHHITMICSSMERSVAFYRDLLGMRLVKQTRNYDDPDARHLYFGDADGAPGTVVSLFEYAQMEPGRVGVGSTHHFALCVESEEELAGWRDYLRSRGVSCTEVLDRTYFRSVYLRDPDGHVVEIASRGPGFAVDEAPETLGERVIDPPG